MAATVFELDVESADRYSHALTAIPVGGDVFITAAHGFNWIASDHNAKTADLFSTFVHSPSGTSQIVDSVGFGFGDYDPTKAEVAGTDSKDRANFTAPSASVPASQLLPMVTPEAAASFFKDHSSVTLATYKTPSRSGTFEAVTSWSQFTATFASATEGGDSGGAVSTIVGGSEYLVGMHIGAIGSLALENYFNYSFYKKTNALIPSGTSFSGLAPDLVFGGGAPHEELRGSIRKADLITSGDDNTIVAGTAGDVINAGLGQGVVAFMPAARSVRQTRERPSS